MPGPYIFPQIFAVDPYNKDNVATDASIVIYAPGDPGKTALTITDASTGLTLANPVQTNAHGFGPTIAHTTLDQVAWAGGGFEGTFESYRGMKDSADAAADASQASAESSQESATSAELAAANAAAGVAVALAATVDEAEAAKDAAQAAAGLVGAPAGSAVLAAISEGGAARGELNAAIGAQNSVQVPPLVAAAIAADSTPANAAAAAIDAALVDGRAISKVAAMARPASLTGSPIQPKRLHVGRPRMIASDGLYNAFASFAITDTGRLITAYMHGTAHDNAGSTVRIAYSDNKGATWVSLGDVFTPTGNQRMKSFQITNVGGGKLYGIGWYSDTTNTPNEGRMFTSSSTDNGLTWSARALMTAQPHTLFSATETGVVILDNGNWMTAAYGKNGASGFWTTSIGISTNQGTTWAWTEKLDGDIDSISWTEPTLQVTPNGAVQCLIRNLTDGKIWRMVYTQTTGTWGTNAMAFVNNGKPAQAVTSNGSVVTIVRDQIALGDGLLRFSRDNGATWTDPQTVSNGRGTFSYAAMHEITPGVLAVVSSHDAGNTGSISDLFFLYISELGSVTPFGDNDLWQRSPHAAILGTSRGSTLAYDTMERNDENPAGRMDSGHVWYNWGFGHKLVNGRLKGITASTPSGALTAFDLRRGDYHEISTRILSTAAFTGGIVFQMLDNQNYYLLNLAGEAGTVIPTLYKAVSNVLTVVKAGTAQDLSTNVEYPVKITIRAGRIKCFIDDEKVIDVKDSTYTAETRIGIRAGADTMEFGPIAVLR